MVTETNNELKADDELELFKNQKCIILTQLFGSVTKKGKKKKGLELQAAIEKNDKASVAYWKPFFSDCLSAAQIDRRARKLIEDNL